MVRFKMLSFFLKKEKQSKYLGFCVLWRLSLRDCTQIWGKKGVQTLLLWLESRPQKPYLPTFISLESGREEEEEEGARFAFEITVVATTLLSWG